MANWKKSQNYKYRQKVEKNKEKQAEDIAKGKEPRQVSLPKTHTSSAASALDEYLRRRRAREQVIGNTEPYVTGSKRTAGDIMGEAMDRYRNRVSIDKNGVTASANNITPESTSNAKKRMELERALGRAPRGILSDYMLPLAVQSQNSNKNNPLSSSQPNRPKVQRMVGNVDINDRPIFELGNGQYATTESTFQERWKGDEENGHYDIGHFATITKDGRKMSDDEMNEYIDKVMSSDDPFETDRKGLNLLYKIDSKLANGEYIRDNNLEQAFKEADAWDVDMHNLQDSMYRDKRTQKVSAAAMDSIRNATPKGQLNNLTPEEAVKQRANGNFDENRLLNAVKRGLNPNSPNSLVSEINNTIVEPSKDPFGEKNNQPTENARDRIAYSAAARRDPENPLVRASEEAKRTRGILPEAIRQYTSMSPIAKQRYNELYGEYGVERAEDFRKSLQNYTNYQIAQENYDQNPILHNPVGRTAAQFGQGVSEFGEGMENTIPWALGMDARRPESVRSYEGSIIRNRSTSKLEDIAQDLARTSGMMAPSALTGAALQGAGVAAGGSIGSALFGASIGGRTYQETINEGYSRGQAAALATQQAVDEYATNALLGGISAYGGGALRKYLGNTRVAQAATQGLSRAMQTALSPEMSSFITELIGDGVSEASQEFLQNYTEKISRNIILGEQNEISLTDPEAWYSAALGALNSVVMNSASAAVSPHIENVYNDMVNEKRRAYENANNNLVEDTETNGNVVPETTQQQVSNVVNAAVDTLLSERGLENTSESTPDEAKNLTETLVNEINNQDIIEGVQNIGLNEVSEEVPDATMSRTDVSRENDVVTDTISDIPNTSEDTSNNNTVQSIDKLQQIAEGLPKNNVSEPKGQTANDNDLTNQNDYRTNNLEKELKRRGTARFANDENAKIVYDAYFEDFRSRISGDADVNQIVSAYDDNMAKAYNAGLQGKSLNSLSEDRNFSRFDDAFHDLTDAMWQMGINKYNQNNNEFVENYKKLYGEQGQSAFSNMVRLNENFADDVDAFTRIYNAGRYGKDTGDFSRFGERSREIYQAGVNDSEAEYEKIAKAVKQFEKNPKKATGGIFINTTGRASKATVAVMEKFSKNVPFPVIVVDTQDQSSLESVLDKLKQHDMVDANATVKGVFDTNSSGASDVRRGFVVIDINTDNFLNTLGHELTHIAKVYDLDGYRAYSRAVLDKLSSTEGYNLEGKIAEMQRLYKQNFNQDLTREEAEEEIVAESADFLNDEDVVRELVSKNKSFAEKIRDWLRSVADMLKELMDTTTSRVEAKALKKDHEFYTQAAELWTNMIENAGKNFGENYSETEKLIRNQLDLSEGLGTKVNVPGNPMSAEDIFSLDDELMDKSDKYDEATKNAWKNIIEAPDFVSLGFPKDDHWYYTLTPSARKEYAYQLTHFDENGPIGDSRYKSDDMDRLYSELVTNTPGEGVDATVVKISDMIGSLPEQTRFQMNKPIEKTKDFIAVHNLSAEQLLNSLEMGGFPSPSIAVIKDSMSHTKYGDTTVMFYRETVDPEFIKKNKIYGGDAWTPTYPTIDYKVNEKELKKIAKTISELAGMDIDAFGHAGFDSDNVENALSGKGTLANTRYSDLPIVKLAYLNDNGVDVELKYKEKTLYNKLENTEIAELAKALSDEDLEKYTSDWNYGYEHKEEVEKVRKIANEIVAKNKKDLIDHAQKEYEKTKKSFLKKNIEHYINWFNEDNFRGDDLYALAKAVREYRENGSGEKILDTYATRDYIKELMKGREEDYDKWINELFGNIVEKKGIRNSKDMFLPSGNRRSWEALHDSVTLDNLTKAMNKRDAKGDAFFSVMGIKAIATKDFSSIDEAHKNEHLLKEIDEEEYKKLQDEYATRFTDIVNEILPKNENEFVAFERTADIIADTIRTKKTVRTIDAELRKWLPTVKPDTAQKLVDLMEDVSNMPTGYFEAKPQRSVYNNEIAEVITPDSGAAHDQLIEAMKNKGIAFKEYKAGNEEDRTAKVNDTLTENPNIRFQITSDTSGRELSPEQSNYFANSEVIDKDGRLMVMYHGTPNGSFNTFRDGINFFTSNKEYATQYEHPSQSSRTAGKVAEAPKTYEVYLNITHPFDIRNAEDRKAFIDDYVKGGWALGIDPYVPYKDTTKTGLPSWEEADNIYEWMEENDLLDKYDGILVDEGGTESGFDRGISYVTFNPNQIKNVDNENPTDSDDIRYQLDIPSDMFYNEDSGDMRTEQANVYLTNILQASKDHTPSEKDIKKVVKEITDTYNSKMSKKELTRQLTDLYTYMRTNEHVDGAQVSETINAIARQVIREATFTDEAQQKIWDNFRKEMRNTDIYVNPEFVRDIDPDGMMNLRKRYFGRVKLTSNPEKSGNDGIRTYLSLQQQFPDIYTRNIDDIASDADAIREILYGFETARPRELSVFGDASTEDEAAEDLAQRIMDAYFEVGNESVKTQYQKTYKQLREEMKEDIIREYNDNLKAIQIDDTKKLSNLKKSYSAGNISEDSYIVKKSVLEDYKRQQSDAARDLFRNKRDKYIDRIQRNKYKDDIIKTSKQLAKMILSPTDKQHIPTEMVEPISKVLQYIDFSSNRVNPDGSLPKRTVESDEFHNSITSILGILGKIDKNQSVYENNGETSYLVIDPDLMQNLRELSDSFSDNDELKNNIDNLSTQNLRTVQQTLRALRQMVNNANRFISMERAGTVSELAKQSIADFDKSILNRGKIRQKVDEARKMPALKMFDELLTAGMLDAYTYCYGLGDTGLALYDDVRAGLDRKIRNTRTAVEYMEDSMERNNVSVKERNKWENDLIEVELRAVPIGGRTASNMKVKLSAAQIMSLYLLNKRGQARMHLYADSATNNVQNGGFILEPSGKNKLKMDDKHVFKVTERDVENIVSKLTPQQKAVADDIGRFLTDVTSKWGNEVTQKLYGYNKFEAKNYFPIKVDNSTIATTSSTLENAMFLLKNIGQTKTVQQRAYNPVTLQNIFDVYCTQADDMGSYNAFVTSTADLQMWINYKGEEGNIKRALTNAYGKKATDYFMNLLKDINMPRENGSKWDKALGNLVGLQRGGAIWGNLRVAVQQPFAYIRAAATMDPKYLLKGLTLSPAKQSEEWELAKKYAPIAQWKDYGFFDIGVGPSMKRVIMGNDTLKDKVAEAGMQGASMGDTIAWVRLWNAAQAQTKAEHPELKAGSEEFYQEAGKIFGHVVDTTQVVDSVLHRSDIMKDKSTTVKNATAFLSEPTKTYNMLFRAIDDFVTSQGKEKKTKGKALANTLMVWTVSQVVNSAVASVVSALRNHDKDKDLIQKYIDKVVPDFMESMMIWNSIPMIKQWLSALSQNDQDDDASYELLSLIPSMISELRKAAEGKSKKGWWGLLYQASQLTTFWGGNNLQNPLRDIDGVIDNIIIGKNDKLYYQYQKAKNNMYASQESSSGSISYPNLKQFIATAMKAYAHGDKQLGNKIIEDLKKGIPEDKVDSALINTKFSDKSDNVLDQALGSYMKSRFSKFNKIYENEEETSEGKKLKQEVINDLIDYKKDTSEGRKTVYDIVEETGDKTYLPSILDDSFKNGSEVVQLTSAEYLEYQDIYENNYYKYMNDHIRSGDSEDEWSATKKKAKTDAKNAAMDELLRQKGISKKSKK